MTKGNLGDLGLALPLFAKAIQQPSEAEIFQRFLESIEGTGKASVHVRTRCNQKKEE